VQNMQRDGTDHNSRKTLTEDQNINSSKVCRSYPDGTPNELSNKWDGLYLFVYMICSDGQRCVLLNLKDLYLYCGKSLWLLVL